MRPSRRKWVGVVFLLAVLALCNQQWLCRAEIGVIEAYQDNLSAWMGRWVQCRFRPTCSHYAVESLRSSGFLRGNLRIAKRLALCSPLGWALSYGETRPKGLG